MLPADDIRSAIFEKQPTQRKRQAGEHRLQRYRAQCREGPSQLENQPAGTERCRPLKQRNFACGAPDAFNEQLAETLYNPPHERE